MKNKYRCLYVAANKESVRPEEFSSDSRGFDDRYWNGNEMYRLSNIVTEVIPILKKNISIKPLVWSEVIPDDCENILIGPIWGYNQNPSNFSKWIKSIREKKINCLNRPGFIQWNLSKKYLSDLSDWGIKTTPSNIYTPEMNVSWSDVLSDSPWEDFILKPSIGGGGDLFERISKNNINTVNSSIWKNNFESLKREFGIVVQPYCPEYKLGEKSYVFIGGKYSHCFSRTANNDSELNHPHRDGRLCSVSPNKNEISEIEDIHEIIIQKTSSYGSMTHLRIDAIMIDNQVCITEIEGIDPYLHLCNDEYKEELARSILENIK